MVMEVRDAITGKLFGTLNVKDPAGTTAVVPLAPHPNDTAPTSPGHRGFRELHLPIGLWRPSTYGTPYRCLQATKADLPDLRKLRSFVEA